MIRGSLAVAPPARLNNRDNETFRFLIGGGPYKTDITGSTPIKLGD